MRIPAAEAYFYGCSDVRLPLSGSWELLGEVVVKEEEEAVSKELLEEVLECFKVRRQTRYDACFVDCYYGRGHCNSLFTGAACYPRTPRLANAQRNLSLLASMLPILRLPFFRPCQSTASAHPLSSPQPPQIDPTGEKRGAQHP